MYLHLIISSSFMQILVYLLSQMFGGHADGPWRLQKGPQQWLVSFSTEPQHHGVAEVGSTSVSICIQPNPNSSWDIHVQVAVEDLQRED